MPYSGRVDKLLRPEEVDEDVLTTPYLDRVNAHLGTTARNLGELVDQLGIMRFGRRPRISDTFAGVGSIPFEAARLGCDVTASDLNPIACLLTWGSLAVVGASADERNTLQDLERTLIGAVDDKLTKLGIEHDAQGNRAKSFLYCTEALCPRSGWRVPMATSWAISKSRNVIVRLVPVPEEKRFDIIIEAGVTDEEVAKADLGTVRSGKLVYELDGEMITTPIKTIRGEWNAGSRADSTYSQS